MTAMSGVTLYEPDELVLSAKAGTPIAEIEALLAQNNQRLEFEPIDYGPLHGQPSGGGTIGGVIACNLSGPRRIKQGAARDHVLGVKAVSGRGEIFKSGGRVVKNVTGYDLSKGLTGSFGTLAVMTEITIKVLPRTEIETTLVLGGLDDPGATKAMAAAMGSSAEVSGAAHLPHDIAARVSEGALGNDAATCVRLEGFGPSVAARVQYLRAMLGKLAPVVQFDGDASRRLWVDLRDVRPFADGSEDPVWRLSVVPSRGHEIVARLKERVGVSAFYDWQGGLVWLRLHGDAQAEMVREAIQRHGGGHATLVHAPEQMRAATAVFQPQPPPLAALSRRLKEQFDPAGILNPGRMS